MIQLEGIDGTPRSADGHLDVESAPGTSGIATKPEVNGER